LVHRLRALQTTHRDDLARPSQLGALVAPERLNGLARLGKNSQFSCCRLAAVDAQVGTERVQLDSATNRLGFFGGDRGRAGDDKWVDGDVAASAKSEDLVTRAGRGSNRRKAVDLSA
jgi:hypothetical protein